MPESPWSAQPRVSLPREGGDVRSKIIKMIFFVFCFVAHCLVYLFSSCEVLPPKNRFGVVFCFHVFFTNYALLTDIELAMFRLAVPYKTE